MGLGSITTALFCAVLSLLTLTIPARAQDERIIPPDEQAIWAAVGRINTGPTLARETCTGTLIAPTVVLTAGHCIRPLGPEHPPLAFLPGYRADAPIVWLDVAGTTRHPNARYPLSLGTIPDDLGLLTLAMPSQITPLPLGPAPVIGESLAILSYRNSRLDAPTLTTGCTVIRKVARLITLDCPVAGGMSGAPVLRVTERGPEITAILSASGGPISFAAVPDDWAD